MTVYQSAMDRQVLDISRHFSLRHGRLHAAPGPPVLFQAHGVPRGKRSNPLAGWRPLNSSSSHGAVNWNLVFHFQGTTILGIGLTRSARRTSCVLSPTCTRR